MDFEHALDLLKDESLEAFAIFLENLLRKRDSEPPL